MKIFVEMATAKMRIWQSDNKEHMHKEKQLIAMSHLKKKIERNDQKNRIKPKCGSVNSLLSICPVYPSLIFFLSAPIEHK